MPLDRTWVNGLVDDDGSNTIGEVWNKADVQHIYDDVDKLAHYCELARVTPHDVGQYAWSGVYWDYKVSDPVGMCSVPNTYILPPVDGWYSVTPIVQWPAGTGQDGLAIWTAGAVDGGPILAPALNLTVGGLAGTYGLSQTMTRIVHAGPTRQIEIKVYLDGATLVQLQPSSTRVAVHRVS
jgi:hypothetical protein